MRARSALFTLFGDVVRPAGGEAWLATLTACMATLGFTPEATRTALHRMAGEGWVEPRRVGRYAAYRLTARGVDRLEEAATRIYALRSLPWDGRWRVLVSGAIGDAPDLARELAWMGFGRLDHAVWVSPHPHGTRLRSLLEAHGLVGEVTGLVGTAELGGDDLVHRAWDLETLEAAYSAFLEAWADPPPPATPAEAFGQRVRLVHEWRKFLFLDPGLPAAVLPEGWVGFAAAERFRECYEDLEDAAWRFYEDLRAVPAPAGPPPARRPERSPFARGLAALQDRGAADAAARRAPVG